MLIHKLFFLSPKIEWKEMKAIDENVWFIKTRMHTCSK